MFIPPLPYRRKPAMNKFEQLLDFIVNEEKEKAEELFHEIVVEKSRDIYESLIAEETQEEQVEEASDEDDEEATEEATDADEEAVEEAFGMDDEGEAEVGGDATDDLAGDVAADDGAEDEFGGEEGGDETPATKSDVQDLEDALDELKAEFERLMAGDDAGEEGGEEEAGDEFGGEEEAGEDEGGEEEGENPFEGRQMTREYRETVGKPYGSGNGISNKSEQGDGKAGPVSSGKGKPTSGATAKNIAQGDTGGEGIKGGEGLVGGVKGEFTKGVEKNIASSSKAGMKSGSALDGKGKAYGAGGASTSETGAANTKSIVDRKQS
jgi:hypothetical protein